MGDGFERRRTAVASLVRAAFDRFAAEEGQPQFGPRHGPWRWWRHGQDIFVGVQPGAWMMPADLPIVGWLDGFPEMTEVRSAYAEDSTLGPRVDSMLGVEFARTGTNFYWILVQHVVEPLVVATRTYAFDKPAFDEVYQRFEDRFRASHIRMIEFRALNGFDSSEDSILLPDGLVLQRMTDKQMSLAINALAVPRMPGGAANNAQVQRFDQWALKHVEEFPVIAGEWRKATPPRAPEFPVLEEPGLCIVRALRLVVGGSVVATRSMHQQADSEFPFVPNGTVAYSAFAGADNDRPTILLPTDIKAVCDVYAALGLPQVRADKSLQVAIRCLLDAGSRSFARDRLIDLATCAEALFIKRANKMTAAKGALVAEAAASVLGTDPVLNTDAEHLQAFMKMIYRARNAEVHGDDKPYAPLFRLDGEATTALAAVVADLEMVLRRAILTVLHEHTTSISSSSVA